MATTWTAGAAGLLLGCPVALIWLSISMRLGQTDFWTSGRHMMRSLLGTVDAREFCSQYGQLLKLLAQYLARNLLLTAGASLPVIVFVLFVAPAAMAAAQDGPTSLAIVGQSDGNSNAFESFATPPEFAFYAALSLASSAGILLLPKRPR